MTRTKHTPGPWETPGTDGGDRVISHRDKAGKRRTLAHVYALNAEERDATARLIAAALTMRNALERILRAVDDGDARLPAEIGMQASAALALV